MPSRRGRSLKGFFTGWLSSNRGIALILALFLVLGTIYSLVTPLFEASDELWHYPFVKHLADGSGLPVQQPGVEQPWRQEGSQPPLYYALAALATFWIDTSDMEQVRWRNPHADIGVPKPDGNANMVIHTEREAFPYRGTVLAVHIVRWLSVLMGAVTVFCTYCIARELFPDQGSLALGAAAFVAFNPMFLFISGSVNNDNLANALSSFTLWRLLRLLRGENRFSHLALIGASLGAAALAKASALGLFALAGLALACEACQQRSWRWLIQSGILIYGLAVAICGWWFVRNWRLYGDPSGLSTFVAIVGPRYPKPTLRQLWGERVGFTMSFWGFFGGLNVPMSSWVYRLLDGLAGISLLGLLAFFVKRFRVFLKEPPVRLLLVLAWPLIVLASLIRWTLMTIATQGRLMFAAISAIAVLFALGWLEWAPRRWRGAVTAGLSFAFFALAAVVPFVYIAPAYARPPILSEAQLPNSLRRLDVDFGGKMRLLGYQLDREDVRPGESVAVTLCWQALQPMAENYSVFVHLLSGDDLIIGQRDIYPGRGSYPTSLWQAGDVVADTYVIPVSPATLAPATAQLATGLYLLESGARLPAFDAQGQALGDRVLFGRLSIQPRQGELPNPVFFNLDGKVALVGYELDRTTAQPGEAFHLTLYWRALKRMAENYSVFTQVVGEGHRIWAQKDAWPQEGQAPTSAWKPGQIVKDSYELTVKEDAPAGVFDLQVGMYLGATGQRLNLLGAGGHAQDNRILLGKVRIVRP